MSFSNTRHGPLFLHSDLGRSHLTISHHTLPHLTTSHHVLPHHTTICNAALLHNLCIHLAGSKPKTDFVTVCLPNLVPIIRAPHVFCKMLPGFLYDSYKRYKASTTTFLTWLVTNAPKSARLAGQPNQGPRTKGKARRAAKERLTKGTHIVATSQIVPLAQGLVGDNKLQGKVPRSVIRTLQKSIAVRKECAVWFEAQAKHDEQMLESVESHSHFVNVLAETLEILMPHIAPAKTARAGPNDPHKGKSATPTQIHSSLYANLEMEDHDLEDDGNALDDRARSPDNASASPQESGEKVYEAEVSDEDVVFAVYCMFQDQDQIQEYIRKLWRGYLNGHVSLINASATSNTAIEVAERIEMEFFNAFPAISNWEEVMKTLRSSRAPPGKLDPVDDIARMLNLRLFDSLPYNCLKEWCMEGCYPDSGIYDPRVDRSELSGDEIARRKLVLLREVLCEYLPLIWGQLPTEDALTTGLRELWNTKNIHAWMTFALQVFLDINCILGSKAGEGLKELQETGETIRASVEDYLSYSPVLEGIQPDGNIETLRALSKLIHGCIINDSIMATREKVFGKAKAMFGPGKPFYLLSQHPMLCGLLKFAITLKQQRSGMIKTNYQGFVLATAHLYNAAQQDGSMSNSWVAMDELITLWNPEQIYFGPTPTEPAAWYDRYVYVEGMPAEYFAPNKRKRIYTTRPQRDYKEPFQYPRLMWTLLERYCKTDPQSPGMTMEEVELLLSKRRSSRLRKQWDKSHKLSPVQLLEVLRDWIAEEEPKMLFNYFGIYKHCLELMRSLVKAMRGNFEPWIGSQHFGINEAA